MRFKGIVFAFRCKLTSAQRPPDITKKNNNIYTREITSKPSAAACLTAVGLCVRVATLSTNRRRRAKAFQERETRMFVIRLNNKNLLFSPHNNIRFRTVFAPLEICYRQVMAVSRTCVCEDFRRVYVRRGEFSVGARRTIGISNYNIMCVRVCVYMCKPI